jgi:hypothetical protein
MIFLVLSVVLLLVRSQTTPAVVNSTEIDGLLALYNGIGAFCVAVAVAVWSRL